MRCSHAADPSALSRTPGDVAPWDVLPTAARSAALRTPRQKLRQPRPASPHRRALRFGSSATADVPSCARREVRADWLGSMPGATAADATVAEGRDAGAMRTARSASARPRWAPCGGASVLLSTLPLTTGHLGVFLPGAMRAFPDKSCIVAGCWGAQGPPRMLRSTYGFFAKHIRIVNRLATLAADMEE